MSSGIDGRNDRVMPRLTCNDSGDVKDTLLFGMVRSGDQVEITMETIGGARTIVGLTKQ